MVFTSDISTSEDGRNISIRVGACARGLKAYNFGTRLPQTSAWAYTYVAPVLTTLAYAYVGPSSLDISISTRKSNLSCFSCAYAYVAPVLTGLCLCLCHYSLVVKQKIYMLPGKKSNRNKFGIKRRRMFRRITYPKSPKIRFGEKFLLAFEIYVECLHNYRGSA